MNTSAIFGERSVDDEHFFGAFANPQGISSEAYPNVLGQVHFEAKQRFISAIERFAGLRDLDIEAACALASIVAQCVVDLNVTAELHGDLASAVECGVVQGAFPAVARRRMPEKSFEWVMGAWQLHARAFGALPETVGRLRLPASDLTSGMAPLASAPQEMAVYNVAVGKFFVRRDQRDRTSQMIRALRVHLGLSCDELGSILRISGFEARSLENGQIRVGRELVSLILSMYEALERLLAIIRPERLPEAIGRPAEAFRGERALDWILRGRITEVADSYEEAVRYQA